jgi:predicted PurR-regulated permease PerM
VTILPKPTSKITKTLIIIAVSALALWLIINLWLIIVPFFFALLFAYILQPAVGFLISKKITVSAAILLTYAILFGILSLVLLWGMPLVLAQLNALVQYLPELFAQTELWWKNFQAYFEHLNLPPLLLTTIAENLAGLGEQSGQLLERMALGLVNILRYLIYLILTPVLSYYMLRDKELIKKRLIALLAPKERAEILRIGNDINHLLRQFLSGYLLVASIVGVLTALFLAVIGLEYAILLGLLVAVADLIPFFGPILAAVPIIILAFLQSPELALYALIWMVVIQQLESSIITPKVMGKRIGLHPLITIFVVLAGSLWFGLIGAVVAVPLTAAGLLILRYIYSRLVAYVG